MHNAPVQRNGSVLHTFLHNVTANFRDIIARCVFVVNVSRENALSYISWLVKIGRVSIRPWADTIIKDILWVKRCFLYFIFRARRSCMSDARKNRIKK